MNKDFDYWNRQKKKIQTINKLISFKEREIWWCSLGVNLGDEEDGKNNLYERPVLVVKKFNNRVAWVLPMSTKVKFNKYYHLYNNAGALNSILLSQLKLISVKRFRRCMKKIARSEFKLVKKN